MTKMQLSAAVICLAASPALGAETIEAIGGEKCGRTSKASTRLTSLHRTMLRSKRAGRACSGIAKKQRLTQSASRSTGSHAQLVAVPFGLQRAKPTS